MARAGGFVLSRRLLVASVVLGVFVLFDLALFGWLIFRSLSQREIERTLLETREEAETLARQIADQAAGEEDLYTVVALQRDTRTFIDSILGQREIVEDVEIRDSRGVLVFRKEASYLYPFEGARPETVVPGEMPPRMETQETRATFDIELPIGEVGSLHVGISRAQLEQRIGVLRGDLVRQATFIGVLTLVLLGVAYAAIAWLWRRGRRLQEQAAEAERLAYVGTLASGLAHEIRNPLNSLNLNMQLLEEDLVEEAGGQSRRLLGITRSEIGRLERLVTDFLSYARPRPPERQVVVASQLLERTREVLAGQARAQGIELSARDETGGARVRVDPSQMRQLLLNLAQNALAAVAESDRPGRVELVARSLEGRVALEVSDTGVGIPEENRARIFDLFYSTKKGGTGLGLAIVKRIADAHDVTLEVDSRRGEGTVVRVSLEALPGTSEGTLSGLLREAHVASHSQMSSS